MARLPHRGSVPDQPIFDWMFWVIVVQVLTGSAPFMIETSPLPQSSPHRAHLRHGRHRHGLGADLGEAGHGRVGLRGVEGLGQCGGRPPALYSAVCTDGVAR